MTSKTLLVVILLVLGALALNLFEERLSTTSFKVEDTSTSTPPTKQTEPIPPVLQSSATTSPVEKTPAGATPKATTTHPGTLPVAPAPEPPKGSLPLPAPPQPTEQEYEAAAAKVRSALVNIICETSDSKLHSISGSGAFIDSRGIIVTAAHVAQLFLLKDYPKQNDVSCVIRTGSPAHDAYTAVPLYISESWTRANLDTLLKTDPTGTGENDFAFLAVTKSAPASGLPEGRPLPSYFPSLPLAKNEAGTGTPVVIGSYGAQFIPGNQILSSLYPTLVFGSVKDVFTFRNNTIDLLSLGGTVAAQQGSSGGVAIDVKGNVAGIITTSTVSGDTSTRDLRAITPLHVRTSFRADTGKDLDSLLAGNDIASLTQTFAEQMSALTDLLVSALER